MNKLWQRKLLVLCLAVAGLNLCAKVTHTNAAPQEPAGALIVTGRVQVDGKVVNSGDTLSSGATVTTAKNSSAVVSLGKLGRVEVFPESTLVLSFTETGMTAHSRNGNLQIAQLSSFTASVLTDDGEVVADGGQANTFTVNTRCGNTVVSTQSGRVEMRAGGEVKQVPAGSQASVGKVKPERCKTGSTMKSSGRG